MQNLNILTEREKEVMELVCKGKTNFEICKILNIAMATTKTHLHNVYAKYSLFANNRKDYSIMRLQAALIYLKIL